MNKLTKYMIASRAVNTYGKQSKTKQLFKKVKDKINSWRNVKNE
jgi:hypothetical protein